MRQNMKLERVSITLLKKIDSERWEFESNGKRYTQNMKIADYSGYDFNTLKVGDTFDVHPWVVEDASLVS